MVLYSKDMRAIVTASLALILAAATIGCDLVQARIPNVTGPEEYEIYSAWVRQFFAKQKPQDLYILNQTFVFDPQDPARSGCSHALPRAEVSPSLVKQLHALGGAQFKLDSNSFDRNLTGPWPHTMVDTFPSAASGFQAVGFSRVALNRQHSEALFSVKYVCGGLCGNGGPLLAKNAKGAWTFRSVGCWWIAQLEGYRRLNFFIL